MILSAQTDDDRAAERGITLTAEHRNVLAAMRLDHADTGTWPTLRRTSTITGLPMDRFFALFPGAPAETMAYVAASPAPARPDAS